LAEKCWTYIEDHALWRHCDAVGQEDAMKFAICNEIFWTEDADKWTVARQFEAAAQIGFDGMEISPLP